jgi:hypothetical protein
VVFQEVVSTTAVSSLQRHPPIHNEAQPLYNDISKPVRLKYNPFVKLPCENAYRTNILLVVCLLIHD